MTIKWCDLGNVRCNRNDSEQQPNDFYPNDNYDDWKAHQGKVWSIIWLSWSPEEQHIVKGITDLYEVQNAPETSLDTANTYIHRLYFLPHFRASPHMEDKSLKSNWPSLTMTAYNRSTLTMKSSIMLSPLKASHHCQHPVQWYSSF